MVVVEEFGTHKQTIVNGKVCTSTSPNSELIVDVNIKVPAPGFTNTLLKVTVCELPAVTLLLSGGDWAIIFIPGLVLDIVKVPKTNPVLTSLDWIIAWFIEIIELIVRTVLKLRAPPLALITAEPIVSPTLIVEIANDPLFETNKEVAISGSFGSWLTLMVKSVKLSQLVLDKETLTVGLNGIQGEAPVLPPTQLPQLSIHALPLGSPLQSKQ